MLQWGGQIERFSASHSVVAFDAYGCGRSPKPRDWAAYSFDALTADLVAVLKCLVPPGSAPVLVAHSAGCSLAIAAVAAGLDAGLANMEGLCLLGGYVEPPAPHPVFYLPVPLLNLIQPMLSSGFEVRPCRERKPQALEWSGADCSAAAQASKASAGRPSSASADAHRAQASARKRAVLG
jgi:pimeloyl-ACP methyl ester carboxylesterase